MAGVQLDKGSSTAAGFQRCRQPDMIDPACSEYFGERVTVADLIPGQSEDDEVRCVLVGWPSANNDAMARAGSDALVFLNMEHGIIPLQEQEKVVLVAWDFPCTDATSVKTDRQGRIPRHNWADWLRRSQECPSNPSPP